MSIRLASHLHRNRYGVFGFRVVVPHDLRAHFQSVEYRLSLRTAELRVAKQFAARLALLVKDGFDRLRRMNKDAAPSNAAQILQELDAERHRLGRSLLVHIGAVSDGDQSEFVASMIEAMPDGPVKALGVALLGLSQRERELTDAQRALIVRAIENAPQDEAQVDSFFADLYEEAGKLKNDQLGLSIEIERHRSLIREIDSATRAGEALEQVEANFAGERERLADFAAQIIARSSPDEMSTTRQGEKSDKATLATDVRLSQAVTAYCEEQLASKQWTPKTAEEYRGVLNQWVRIVGDMPIRSYGFEQHREYKGKLLKLPPNCRWLPGTADICRGV